MERLTSRTILLSLVALGVVLAGCAGSNNSTNNPSSTATTPSSDQLTPAGAKALLDSAAAGLPQQFGMSAAVFQGAVQKLTMNATFDNATKTSYLEIHADPSAFGGAASSGVDAAMFANGFGIYSSPEGSLYYANGTAFVFPPGNDTGKSSGGLVPSPDKSPVGQFLKPEDVVGAFKGSNVSVQSVEPATCHNQAAVRIVFNDTQSGQAETVTADVLNTQPARLCHIETNLPKSSSSSSSGGADPFSGGNLRADFYYNGELKLTVPEAITRAVSLRYTSDKSPFAYGGSGGSDQPSVVTYTFDSTGAIALSDVAAEVKDTANATSSSSSSSGMTNYGDVPTLWSMTLDQKSKSQGGVSLQFNDKDGDGKVSKGDTLVITTDAGQEPATVAIKDVKTNTYVVPGPALALVLGLLGVAALLLRRRGR